MEDKRYLTFALGKGRLAKTTLKLFEQIGITCEEIQDPDTRKLIFVNEELKLRFFLAKGPDVPTYVEYGAADIGIVGKDTILEVETGTTLRENGLTVLEEVCPLSARVVVNQVSMKMENERITKLIRSLKTVI